MTVYYNEHDPRAAQWLRVLSCCGEISPGDVDARDVQQVRAEDLVGRATAHFFAGIGGWDYALRLSGWPAGRDVWTASLPCQPFSQAGQQQGTDDERHLWPVFRDLVEQCLPPVIFGEQVASKPGRAWLASVQADLEALGYSTAAADLCAAGVGAPHIRQRLYWCAIRLGVSDSTGREQERTPAKAARHGDSAKPAGGTGGLADSRSTGLEGHTGNEGGNNELRRVEANQAGSIAEGGWDNVVYLPCADGKARPIKPGIEPLVDGLPGRVGLLRGYGNAISPPLAAIFIQSVIEATQHG